MTQKSARRLAVLSAGCLALAATPPLRALEPPTPQQVREYKTDGTWKQRVAQAKALGNHRTDPGLAARTRQRLKQAAFKAIGGPQNAIDQAVDAPPPDWAGGLPSKGTPKVLVLLVDFPEYPAAANQTAADVENKLFGDGDATQYPYDSLRNFYQRSSYNQLTIQGNVLGWYRAQNSRSYYEGLGMGPGEEALMMEALNYYDAQGHDFTQYDNNNDGRIDSFFIKWTGPDNGWANFWWAYEWVWHSNPGYRIDGKSLGNYVWSWISNPVGGVYQAHVDIHETGHLLGLPDLYDYDSSVGPDGGVGGLDMMDSNWGDHNCFSKYMLEWLTPTLVTSGSQNLTLNPSGTSQDCVLVMPGINPGEMFDEFFMVQYRKRSAGNDPASYPTDGYTIWHIDSTLNGSGGFLYDNSYTAHKMVRLMEADGLEEIERGGGADAGDFYRAPASFGTDTTPSSRAYSGILTGVQVDQIGAAGASLSASFSVITAPLLQAAGATLASEGCLPGNGAIDPQETVTVSLSLQNAGNVTTNSLVATLEATGGVTSPSLPQNYGALASGGSAVARPFTFVATGDCGGTLTATLSLQDGTVSLDPVSFIFTLGPPVVPFSQDFDAMTAPALPDGWVATVASGTVAPWATATASVDTAPNAVFSADPGSISDNWLDSPVIPIASAAAQLLFRHSYDTESSYDGGVLEIAIGAGAFTDILSAGGSFASGGYVGTISTSYQNPLAGRRAWTGSSNGFITTAVNLPAAAAGQDVRFRWRLGSDTSVSRTGWYVDTISLHDIYGCCQPMQHPGDFDGDGDADQEDFGRMQACITGPNVPQNDPACYPARLDADGDVDSVDVALFLKCHTQPGVPADINCRSQ